MLKSHIHLHPFYLWKWYWKSVKNWFWVERADETWQIIRRAIKQIQDDIRQSHTIKMFFCWALATPICFPWSLGKVGRMTTIDRTVNVRHWRRDTSSTARGPLMNSFRLPPGTGFGVWRMWSHHSVRTHNQARQIPTLGLNAPASLERAHS